MDTGQTFIRPKEALRSWSARCRVSLAAITALSAISALCSVTIYALVARAAAMVLMKSDESGLYLLWFALIPLFIKFLTDIIQSLTLSRMSGKLETVIRSDITRSLIACGPFSKNLKPEAASFITDAPDEIVLYFKSYLASARNAMAVPLVMLGATALASPMIGLGLLIASPLIPVFMVFIGRGAEKLNQKQWVGILRLSAHFLEAIRNIPVIKIFALEKREMALISKNSELWRLETMKVLKLAFLSALALEFFATVGVAFCAVTLGFAVYEHGFDPALALFCLMCVPEFFIPLRQLGASYHARMRSLGALMGMAETLNEGMERLKSSIALPEIRAISRLELEDVSASYDGNRKALINFSCVFERGRLYVLKGPSGCGKSTVLNLISGLLPPAEGVIKADTLRLESERCRALSQVCALIPQSPYIFPSSVRENLLLGSERCDDGTLIAALDAVGLWELIRSRGGLDLMLGDRRMGLSGGQARLLAFSRALLRKSPVIALDEPTASLDKRCEDKLCSLMLEAKKDAIVITASHRPDLIARADRVITFGDLYE